VSERALAKRVIGGIYSWAADTVYEPLVVQGAFKVFGGSLHRFVRDQALAAARVAADRPILDLPVGTGTFTMTAAGATDGIVVGADIASGMVRQAKANALRAGLRNLVGVQADAHHLPFPDGAFGAILCTNGLQVMPGLAETLAELRRVLADDGRLYVSVVNLPLSSAPSAPTLLMSRPQLKRALQSAGFTVTRLDRERLATFLEVCPN
jgi:ubiquinone/menaquinone biosynthesis C-methylase UbiE